MARVQEVLAGRYELLDVLGRGGMGVVYRARDRVLDRAVAVKVLPVDRAEDRTFVARFQREAFAAAALSDPNIVAVFDSGQDGETRFIVMEYVAGESLAQLIHQRGRVPAEEAVTIATQIASALAAAHRAGIVHRDIKPGNAMLDNHGTVKVLDFGIARAAGGTSLTQTATVLGSASYLAPEVSRGQPADARSDIYALGCLLYELVTGRPPFTGELPAAILHQHNTAIPRSPRDLNPAVPVGLDALIMRMLAKDPSQRPQHAAELVEALPASLRVQETAWSNLERAGLGLATLLVLVGLGVWLLGSSGSQHQAAPAHVSRPAAAHAAAAPQTVGAAVRALTKLTTQDLHAGAVDRTAAGAILASVQAILTADNGGLRRLDDLSRRIRQLAALGDIKPTALPELEVAVANLRSALARATPSASSATTTVTQPAAHGPPAPAPGAGHGPKRHGPGPAKPPKPGKPPHH
jgi:predicted Ser/Thr protein kinase